MDAGSRSFRILLAPIGGGTSDETNDALDNFCSGSYGARRFPLDSERVDRCGVRACPQTDRILGSERSVLFLRRFSLSKSAAFIFCAWSAGSGISGPRLTISQATLPDS